MLQNAYLLATFGFDTAENEPTSQPGTSPVKFADLLYAAVAGDARAIPLTNRFPAEAGAYRRQDAGDAGPGVEVEIWMNQICQNFDNSLPKRFDKILSISWQTLVF